MFTQDIKNKMRRYAEIKLQMKQLEAEADEINPQILDAIQEKECGEVTIADLGKITVSSRKKWTYSKALTEREESVKKDKKVEEQTGEATCTENFFLLFKGDENIQI